MYVKLEGSMQETGVAGMVPPNADIPRGMKIYVIQERRVSAARVMHFYLFPYSHTDKSYIPCVYDLITRVAVTESIPASVDDIVAVDGDLPVPSEYRYAIFKWAQEVNKWGTKNWIDILSLWDAINGNFVKRRHELFCRWDSETMRTLPRSIACLPREVKEWWLIRITGLHSERDTARIGRVGDWELCLYNYDDAEPHFHYRNTRTWHRGSMKLLSAEYFPHGRYTAQMSDGDRSSLVDFMASPMEYIPSIKNFQFTCMQWNLNNPEWEIPGDHKNLKMPDYRNM